MTSARLRRSGGSARMVKKLDCRPGDRAPASATYMLCDDLGIPRGFVWSWSISGSDQKTAPKDADTHNENYIARRQVDAPQFSFSLNIRPYRHHTTTDSYASPCRGWRHYATGESRGLSKKTVACRQAARTPLGSEVVTTSPHHDRPRSMFGATWCVSTALAAVRPFSGSGKNSGGATRRPCGTSWLPSGKAWCSSSYASALF